MIEKQGNKKPINILKLLARIFSIIFIVFVLLFFVGSFFEESPSKLNLIGILKNFLFFPIGLFLGYILSWKWPVRGALVSLLCLVYFQFTSQGPALMALFAIPPILYLIDWFRSRK